MCTLVTSGQVASKTARPRRCASAWTALETPCALKMTVAAVRHFVKLLDEHRAELAQAVHDVAVVDHLVAHVDRRAEQLQRPFDDVDGAIDAGAEAAGIGEQSGIFMALAIQLRNH
jgi:hypothetical protein